MKKLLTIVCLIALVSFVNKGQGTRDEGQGSVWGTRRKERLGFFI